MESERVAEGSSAVSQWAVSLVRYAAGRFRSRGPEEMEDVVQVGMSGLIKAIDRFELSREVDFTSFAIPYVVGEIKRFFRDTTWAVHVPRRLQEARVQLARATEELRSRLGRTPTVKELSELMSLPEGEVMEARTRGNRRTVDERGRGGTAPRSAAQSGSTRRPDPAGRDNRERV